MRVSHFSVAVLASTIFSLPTAVYADLNIVANTTGSFDTQNQQNISVASGITLQNTGAQTAPAVTLNSDNGLVVQATAHVEASSTATKPAVEINGANSASTVNNLGTIETKSTAIGPKIALNVKTNFSTIDNQFKILSISDNSGLAVNIDPTGTSVSGNITNFQTALIQGKSNAINITKKLDGKIDNSGTIESILGVAGSGAGIFAFGDVTGGINNFKTGIIQSANSAGINTNATKTLTINNDGQINSLNTSTIPAFLISGPVTNLNNTANGVISSLKSSVAAIATNYAPSSNVNISNQGKILAGGSGVQINTKMVGNIQNDGLIAGGQITPFSGRGILINDELVGNIINSATGIIRSDGAGSTFSGIFVNSKITGKIENAGLIEVNQANGKFARAVSVSADVTGGIINSGTINGNQRAAIIVVGNGPDFIKADVTNSGSLLSSNNSTLNFLVYASGNVHNTATGIIKVTSGSSNGVSITTQNPTPMNFTNDGLIEAFGTLPGICGMSIGRLINGTLTNTGTIKGTSIGNGVALFDETDPTNSTIVTAGGGFAGGFFNTGLIQGQYAFNASGHGSIMNVYNQAGGVLESISATGAGFVVQDNFNSQFSNSGIIRNTVAGGNAILINQPFTGAIVNNSTGQINVVNGSDAIVINKSIAGYGLVNKGLIDAGTGNAIKIVNGQGTNISNSGTIKGHVLLGDSANFDIYAGSSILGNTSSNNKTTLTFIVGTGTVTTGGTFNSLPTVRINSGTVNLNHTIGAGTPSTLIELNDGNLNMAANTFATNFTVNGGTLSIAQPVSHTGLFTQQGGTLSISVTDKNNYGQLSVSKDAVLTKTTNILMNIPNTVTNTLVNGDYFDIVKAGGILADASTFVMGGPILSFTKGVAPNNKDIRITVVRKQLTDIINSPVSGPVAGVLDSLLKAPNVDPSVTDFFNQLLALPNQADVNNAISTLANDVSGGSQKAPATTNNRVFSIVANRLNMIRTAMRKGVDIDGDDHTGYAAGASVQHTAHHGMWMQGFGVKVNQRLRKGITGYGSNTLGAALGLDKQMGEQLVLGVSGSYGYTDSSTKNASRNNSKVRTYQGTLYGTYDLNRFFIDGMVSLARVDTNTIRNIAAGALAFKALADYSGKQLGARAAISVPLENEGINTIHTLSLAYLATHENAYTERGAGAFSLRLQKQRADVLNLGYGLHIDRPMQVEHGTFVPHFEMNVKQDLIGKTVQSVSTFVIGGAPVRTMGAPVAKSSLDFGTGFTMMVSDSFSFSANYNLAFKKQYHAQTGTLSVRYRF